jgi:hypothetical protein
MMNKKLSLCLLAGILGTFLAINGCSSSDDEPSAGSSTAGGAGSNQAGSGGSAGGQSGNTNSQGSSGAGTSGSGGSAATTCTRDTTADTICSNFWGKFGENLPTAYLCDSPFEAAKIDKECSSTSSGSPKWNGYCCP